jgi:O-antigen/teichoic acid export membrane protein
MNRGFTSDGKNGLALNSSSLKNRAVTAVIWSSIEVFLSKGVGFITLIILARLLTPADFGTVGLLSIFIGLASVFIESGFSSALIQRKEVSPTDISSIFYYNIGMALILSTVLVLASPLIAKFFNIPILKYLTWLMAANLLIGSFGSIQRTLITRALDIRKLFISSLIAFIISGAIAIALAWKGYGVWSLGVQTLAATIVSTILLWTLSAWRPKLIISVKAIRSLFKFSSFLLISSLLDTLFSRINTLMIGKIYTPQDLGYYSQADSLQQMPAGILSNIIQRVAFPVFSAAHENHELLRAGLRKSITFVMMINIPLMLGLSVTAKPLIFVLLGRQWEPSVTYLQILCLGGMLWPFHVLNLSVLTAQGRSDLFFRLEIIKKFLGICLISIACFFGITAIAWSSVATGAICFIVNAYYSNKFLHYGFFAQIMDILPYLAVGFIMAVSVWGASLFPLETHYFLLFIQILLGVTVYCSVCYAFRLTAFMESMLIINLRIREQLPYWFKE